MAKSVNILMCVLFINAVLITLCTFILPYILTLHHPTEMPTVKKCTYLSSKEEINTWEHVNNKEVNPHFRPSMTVQESKTLKIILNEFTSAMQTAKIPFILFFGTLLGVYRHHSRIPWDDDIDILVNGSYDNAVIQAIQLLKGYSLIQRPDKLWKFSMKNSSNIPNFDFTWPFIDLYFFDENDTHIIIRTSTKNSQSYRKRDVFPLQSRPFLGSSYQVPCNMERLLANEYHLLNICAASSYNHRRSMAILKKPATTPCESLYNMYPFVFRVKHADYVLETLRVGDCVIGQVKTELPCNG